MKIMKILKSIFYLKQELYKKFKASAKRFRNERKIKATKEIYSVSVYKYNADRHALHMKIVNNLMNKSHTPKNIEKPVAILIGGGSATGKTTLRQTIINKELIMRGIQAITIDPDEIKEYIPEYESLKSIVPNHAAHLVHKESCDISDLLLKKTIKTRKHFIYEGTMARSRKYNKLVKKLRHNKYEIHAYIVDVPLVVAKKRAADRAKITGRIIRPNIIENTHKLVPKTFQMIKHSVDTYQVYDNQHGLTLIAANDFVEPKLYSQFLKKSRMK